MPSDEVTGPGQCIGHATGIENHDIPFNCLLYIENKTVILGLYRKSFLFS